MRLIRHVAQQPLLGLIRDHQGLCPKDRAPEMEHPCILLQMICSDLT